MNPSPSTSVPTPETDNWDSTSIEAPRQKAGDAIERQSQEADSRGHAPKHDDETRQAAEAEAVARRQTPTDDSPVEPA